VKLLTLIRHAKSSWDFPELPDFDRPLNKRGQRNAPDMGKRLADLGIRPDLIVTSPARRAIDTARIIAEAVEYPSETLRQEPRIYEATPGELIRVITGLPDDCGHAFLVGHNPGLTLLANTLTGSSIDNVPTCGVVRCVLDLDTWSKTEPGCGRLIDFDYPKRRPA
jgi:phosphohistidine phosphatase